MIAKWIKFYKTDIWRIRPKDHPRGKSFLIRLIQIIALAVRGFDENKCKFKASATDFLLIAFDCADYRSDVWNCQGIRPAETGGGAAA